MKNHSNRNPRQSGSILDAFGISSLLFAYAALASAAEIKTVTDDYQDTTNHAEGSLSL